MLLKTYTLGPFEVNSYLIACLDTNKAAIIDYGGFNLSEVDDFLNKNNLHLEFLLLTHGHVDHISGANDLQKLKHMPIYMHKGDEFLVNMLEQQLILYDMPPAKPPEKVNYVKNGEIIKLGNIEIRVLATPGHSLGSVCYYIPTESKVFVGDTIFSESIGRTDLPGGSFDQIMKSIKYQLLVLPDETEVFSGHGPVTTIGEEKLNNPFFGKNSPNQGIL